MENEKSTGNKYTPALCVNELCVRLDRYALYGVAETTE